MRLLFKLSVTVLFLLTACKKNETPTEEDPLKAGLIAFYPFNGNALDESGNNYHLTVHDALPANDRFGGVSKAYSFDGVKAFMKIPGLIKADSLREFTISVWVKTETLTNNCIVSLLTKKDQWSCSNFLSFHNTASNYRVIHQMVQSLAVSTCSSVTISDDISSPLNQWTHLVVTQRYKTEGAALPRNEYVHYFNGSKLKGANSSSYPMASFFSLGGVIGCNNTTGDYDYNFNFTKGSIDDLRIYDRALSDDEVLQLYNLDF